MRLNPFHLALLGIFVASMLLNGCAGTQTNPWAAFSPQEQDSWQAIKVEPQFASQMKSAGITPDQAVLWRNAGFLNADDIIGGRQAEFAPEEARNWVDNGISLEKAAPWKKYKFSYGEAVDWRKSTDLSAETARAWVDRGFTTPNMMKSWNKQGFEPFVAEQWAKENFLPPDAKKWRAKDFDAQEASAWHRQGISLSDSIQQRAKGLVPKSMN
jgi:hypothetical protein